jgi:ribosomal protein S18 acetylase RimI-like enzyme
MRAVCAWAAGKGADRVRLWIDERNGRAVGFYEGLGFRGLGMRRAVREGAAEGELAYELLLGEGG